MRNQNLESPLLFALERLLIGQEFANQRLLVSGIVRRGVAFPRDGHAIIPAAILSLVIPRPVDGDVEDAPFFLQRLEQRQMVFLEQSQPLVGMAPLRLVVVLHFVRWLFRAVPSRGPRGPLPPP